jgi:hypothetical protein
LRCRKSEVFLGVSHFITKLIVLSQKLLNSLAISFGL